MGNKMESKRDAKRFVKEWIGEEHFKIWAKKLNNTSRELKKAHQEAILSFEKDKILKSIEDIFKVCKKEKLFNKIKDSNEIDLNGDNNSKEE